MFIIVMESCISIGALFHLLPEFLLMFKFCLVVDAPLPICGMALPAICAYWDGSLWLPAVTRPMIACTYSAGDFVATDVFSVSSALTATTLRSHDVCCGFALVQP